MIAISFALPTESSCFLPHVRDKTRLSRNGVTTIRGRLGNAEVEILYTGVGEKVCRSRLDKFLHEQDFRFLISSGFAGAARGDLRVGDLVLAENFSEAELLATAQQRLRSQAVRSLKLYTAPRIVHSRLERDALAIAQGAEAVDMETETIAQACARHGLALLSLRVISDTPSQPFPMPPDVLFDMERQKIPFVRLALQVITHPATVPRLVRFHGQITRARSILSDALVAFLRDGS